MFYVSNARTRSCGNAAGVFHISVPTLGGKGGHGHLSCLFNTLHRAGKQAWAPPLSIAQGCSSPCSPTMGTAITAWLYKPGWGPTIKGPVTLTLAIRECTFMKTIENRALFFPPTASLSDSKFPPSSFVSDLTCAGHDVLETVR